MMSLGKSPTHMNNHFELCKVQKSCKAALEDSKNKKYLDGNEDNRSPAYYSTHADWECPSSTTGSYRRGQTHLNNFQHAPDTVTKWE